MPIVYQWPERCRFTSSRFHLTTASLRDQSALSPARSASLMYQRWRADYVYAPERGPSKWQDVDAFFARVEGDVNLIRIGDPLRCVPKYNRLNKPTEQPWSDDTLWSDGTGWVEGHIPPYAEIDQVAAQGDNSIVIRGLPPSTVMALYPGDLFELRPGGVATETGNLYQVVVGGNTDEAGRLGVEFRPRLRQGFAPGDMVVLRNPTTVMFLSEPDQGEIERNANVGTFGFSCIEHLP